MPEIPENLNEAADGGVRTTALFAEPVPLLAELVFYGAHNYGNYALCGRSAILHELSPAYAAIARDRTNITPGLSLS